MKSIYKLSEIKPVGNFDSILELLNTKVENLEKVGYCKKVPQTIKKIIEFGFLDVLEKFETPYKGWSKKEQKICLLYLHLLFIRLNNIAQKYLNNIDMEPNHIQLMMLTAEEKYKKIFGELIITED